MVVGSHLSCAIVDWRISCLWWRFGRSTLYLHAVLNDTQSQIWKTIVVLVLANIIAFLIWRFEWLLFLGIGIGVSALAIPKWASLIHHGWMKLAEGLGWVNSRILLGLVFFLLLTPIALLVRLFRKDPLQLRRPDTNSLWHERDHLFEAKDLQNPW